MPIFRAVPRSGFDESKIYRPHATTRLPGNVPYLVDNLWEYARPEDVVSRRHAVYASPTSELALAGATASGRSPSDYVACEVIFSQAPTVFQLSVKDARLHRDLPRLQKLVNDWMRGQAERPAGEQLASAPLFMPGTTRAILEAALCMDAPLASIVRDCVAALTMWKDPADRLEGEVTFATGPADTYTLQPV